MDLTTPGYGPHLTLDLYGCDPARLDDFRTIHNFMQSLPGKLGMELLFPPYSHDFVNTNPKESGVTSIVGLTTSHASIHTYPHMVDTEGREGIAFLDVFSCKPFDVDLVLQLALELFQPDEYQLNVVTRGRKFPGLGGRD